MTRGRPPVHTGCKIEGCQTKHYARGFCRSHWDKDQRGTLNKVNMRETQCQVDGCTYAAISKHMCPTHYNRQHQGRPLDAPVRRWNTIATYWTAHKNVYKARGRAADFDCAWCGRPADHWALRADAPIQKDKTTKKAGLLFSEDVNGYFPLCLAHHRAYDHQHGVNKWAVV